VSRVGLILKKCGKLSNIKALQDGWCYVEDEAAQLVPILLNVSPEQRVLDVCAAPGGKTTHLSALMRNQGSIVALDRNPHRLRSLASNCQRLGATNVSSFVADASQILPFRDHSSPLESALSQQFDGILCDAPCSGLGVLRRHPEGKWVKNPNLIARAQARQIDLLNHVCQLLRPGGMLVYSACSSEPEETYQVLATFCRQHPEFHHESVQSCVPPAGQSLIDQEGNLFTALNPYNMDGFFAARLKKVGS
jgi:16S rRNA (cytosine967-C5)-methyltransferase